MQNVHTFWKETLQLAFTIVVFRITIIGLQKVEGVRGIKEEGPVLVVLQWCQEGPVLVVLQRCHQLGGSMHDGFTTSLDTHSKLQRGEQRDGG